MSLKPNDLMHVDDLVEFLCARLDEDVKAAVAARAYDVEADEQDLAPRHVVVEPAYASYVNHFTPARTLADIRAKRAIIKLRDEEAAINWADGGLILRWLALPYADHPDYREDWRP